MDIHGYPWISMLPVTCYQFRVGRGWVAEGWVAAGSRLGGSRQAAATHPDGNGNGNGNELSGATYAPNQRAQGSHMPFGAPLIADHPHSDLIICSGTVFLWNFHDIYHRPLPPVIHDFSVFFRFFLIEKSISQSKNRFSTQKIQK